MKITILQRNQINFAETLQKIDSIQFNVIRDSVHYFKSLLCETGVRGGLVPLPLGQRIERAPRVGPEPAELLVNRGGLKAVVREELPGLFSLFF